MTQEHLECEGELYDKHSTTCRQCTFRERCKAAFNLEYGGPPPYAEHAYLTPALRDVMRSLARRVVAVDSPLRTNELAYQLATLCKQQGFVISAARANNEVRRQVVHIWNTQRRKSKNRGYVSWSTLKHQPLR